MSVDSRDVNSPKKSKISLDDQINNDSSSASASISNNEESLDSSSNERCVVVDSVIKQTPPRSPPLVILGSDEDSVKIVQILDSFTEEKTDRQRKTNSTSRPKTNRPLFSISFRNQQTARKYKSSIKKFLKDLISNHDPDTEEYDTSDLELDVWEDESEDSQDAPDAQMEDCSLFEIDTKPMVKNDLAVPTYSQEKEKNKKENEMNKPTSCFNCLGSHSLRDCPLPRDGNVIAQNRRQFINRYGSLKTSRYHMDDEQKFANLVPGQISSKLSKALGLSKHRLPRYIYRMRLLGYPPGWMEEAKVSHSGLMLYDSQGKGTVDEYELHNCPPQSEEQSKEKMLAELGQNSTKAYKRRRLTGQSGMSSPRAQSPSLSDLETRKQLLLAELEDGGSSSDTGTQKTPTTPAPTTSNLGKVKSVDLGTPILQSKSPYSRLPNPEKFSVDICDVINFENLPDSTGKYDKMTDLLRKVRTVVSRIQQDEDDEGDGGK
ncbi:Zinc finger CCHC domain-containing protein 8 [Blattella germanica]|nr:Zinc finger CCHC domain-containing protein 8 [Blattella germanica]